MADNTQLNAGTGGDIAASDDIGGVKYQRVKATFGVDGVATDVSATNPLPMVEPDAGTTGTISAADAVVAAPAGDGVLKSGASTAGSIVAMLSPGGDSAWVAQLTGTFGGTTVHFEASVDSTNGTDGNWTNVNGRQTGVVNTVLAGGVTVAGFYRGNVAGGTYFRVRAVGGAGITIAVVLRMSAGSGAVFLNASIPPGSNAIGGVGGTLAHDAVETGWPLPTASYAVLHGTTPTAVAAGDRVRTIANRVGVPFAIGGHPNLQTVRLQFTAAQTNVAVVTVAAGTRIVVTSFQFTLDNASTVFPLVRLGFGATTTPTTTGVIGAHAGVPAGGGFGRGDGSGIIGIGGDDEDLRVTSVGVATGGGVELIVTYYTVLG